MTFGLVVGRVILPSPRWRGCKGRFGGADREFGAFNFEIC